MLPLLIDLTMSLLEKDSMIYLHKNKLHYLIYKKTPEHLLVPKNQYIHKPYLCVFYDPDNQHYLGQLDKDEMFELIDRCNMTSILSNAFDDLVKIYPILKRENYQEIYEISIEQLEID